VVFGSQLVLKLVARWPIIIPLGGAVLAFTAAQMVVNETLLKEFFDGTVWHEEVAHWSIHIVFMAVILAMSWLRNKRQQAASHTQDLEMV
jgi:predicted tellurium resistance membrane protein TerC